MQSALVSRRLRKIDQTGEKSSEGLSPTRWGDQQARPLRLRFFDHLRLMVTQTPSTGRKPITEWRRQHRLIGVATSPRRLGSINRLAHPRNVGRSKASVKPPCLAVEESQVIAKEQTTKKGGPWAALQSKTIYED